uniref:Reverse transcriptase zinc-binding domain-containing protein n=1 Tax=Cannabis sativa TaxID=3483 RepID=A0A803PRA7_CANSA
MEIFLLLLRVSCHLLLGKVFAMEKSCWLKAFTRKLATEIKFDVLLILGCQIDIDRIMATPLSSYPREDKLFWHHSNSAIYNIKSGYHLAESLQWKDTSSPSNSPRKWWDRFWSLNVPKKIKIFAWRVINDAIATAVNQLHRKISHTVECSLCTCGKSVGHALFICTRVDLCLEANSFLGVFLEYQNLNGHDVYSYLVEAHNDYDMEKIICLMWCIWMERNKEVHGTKPKPALIICTFTDAYIDQFQRTKILPSNALEEKTRCSTSASPIVVGNSTTP